MTENKKYAKLICIRHGESLWNARGVWTGWSDIPLSAKGKKEARQASKYLRKIRPDVAFTSGLIRAQETLEIIKRELGQMDLPTFKENAFNERSYGVYTGKNKWEIQKEIGPEKFYQLRRAWDYPIPDGETLKDVYERVMPVYEKKIIPYIKKCQKILFVTHGNTIRALMKHIEKIPTSEIASIEIKTGEIILYTLTPTGELFRKEKLLVNIQTDKQ